MNRFFQSVRLLFVRSVRDRLIKEASALTYQSVLATVPFLAVTFGIAKGFGLEQVLDGWLQKEFADHQEVLSYLLTFSQTTLQEARGGVIAGIGVICLMFTAIRLLASFENSLNGMWGMQQGRLPLRRTGHYLSLLLICPILLAISSSVTIFVSAQFVHLTALIPLPPSAQSLLLKGLTLVPFATSAFLFSVLLYCVPCAPVELRSACVSGGIVAIFFQFIQSWYILFQLRLTKVSAVYGSFVALPLFLVWLWISWLLLLLAGELLVFIQERGWKERIRAFSDSGMERLDVDLSVMQRAAASYSAGYPLTLASLYACHDAPIRALTESVFRLEERGSLLHCGTELHTSALVPSTGAASTRLVDFLFPSPPANGNATASGVSAAVYALRTAMDKSPLNTTIYEVCPAYKPGGSRPLNVPHDCCS
jgi:membrane protein